MSQKHKVKDLVSKTQRKKGGKGQALWSTPIVPGLRRQRWEDYCKFKVNVIYTGSSRSACLKYKQAGAAGWGHDIGMRWRAVLVITRASDSEGATRRV